MLVYLPHNATHFNLYPPAMVALPEREDTVSGEHQQVHINQQPCVQAVVVTCEVAPHVRVSLAKCVDELGGIGTFLMLFARVTMLFCLEPITSICCLVYCI